MYNQSDRFENKDELDMWLVGNVSPLYQNGRVRNSYADEELSAKMFERVVRFFTSLVYIDTWTSPSQSHIRSVGTDKLLHVLTKDTT